MSTLSYWAQVIADDVERTVSSRFCHPTATYRLQFEQRKVTFRDAAAVVPYLSALGVSHLYGSPYLKARAGSPHGYAVVDYRQLDPELGGEQGFGELVAALRAHDMGQIVDVVSNHMSTAPDENLWWTNVLENGPGSPFAGFFDIDWQPIKEDLQDKILLPVLGEQYGQVLEAGELRLEYRAGAFFIRYYQMMLPLDPRTYRVILTHHLEELKAGLPADSEDLRELESIATALEHLPERTETSLERVTERQREKEVIKDRLRKLLGRALVIADFVYRNVQELNGSIADPHSFDRLDQLLDAQVYQLAHWKAAADEINYRRFFDINELAALTMEEPKVFEETHRFIFELLVRGDVNGLRIDHIDGLYDPREYLSRLQWGYLRALGRAAHQRWSENLSAPVPYGAVPRNAVGEGPERSGLERATPSPSPKENGDQPDADREKLPDWNELEPAFLEVVGSEVGLLPPLSRMPPAAAAAHMPSELASPAEPENPPFGRLPLYVVVEKILSSEEPLPEWWLVAGTTGYEFSNSVGGLFVERLGLNDLTRAYGRFIDERLDFAEVAYESKLLILRASMSSELQMLAHRINRISNRYRRSRDFTLNTLHVALREILACFSVYRTYICEGYVSDRDRQCLHRAVAQAKRRNRAANTALFDFIREVLLLQLPPGLDEAGERERAMFVGRFQQVTSPVVAKGVEDTAFYRYCPLASLNEVGGNPAHGVTTVAEFHRQNQVRQGKWPRSLLCTTTHDTKRSEDVRARISVLSEIPHLWHTALRKWARLNRKHRREVDGQPAPCRNDEYLFYQTLVGVWPLTPPDAAARGALVERMQRYMEKATREAKEHTSWISPDAGYDSAVREFVAATLDGHAKNRFLSDFCAFHERIVDWGLYGALAQTLLRLTSPGVPDIYQGQELWDFSLVDPDNRRPVNFALRRELLERLQVEVEHSPASRLALLQRLAENPRDPQNKLLVHWQTLQFRRQHAALLQQGRYLPLEVQGAKAEHVCAFAWLPRSPSASGAQAALVVVPRLIAQLTRSPEGPFLSRPPLGDAVWQDTSIVLDDLPTALPPHLTHWFTGQRCPLDRARLLVATALGDYPVALLTGPLPGK